jgi:hypothetical protein
MYTQLYSLALQCPFDLGCATCPLKEIRRMDIQARLSYVEELPANETKRILLEHYENYTKNYNFSLQMNHIIWQMPL